MSILALDQISLAPSKLYFEPHCGSPSHKQYHKALLITLISDSHFAWVHGEEPVLVPQLSHVVLLKSSSSETDKVCRCSQ